MSKNLILLAGLALSIFSGCQYQNAEEIYLGGEEIKPVNTNGLLAHITFDKRVIDISENKRAVAFQGDPTFVTGVDGKDSSAISLQGYPQCIAISNLGLNDTLSVFLWFKTNGALAKTDLFTLFDYGVNSFAMQIDGSTGSTLMHTTHNEQESTVSDWINSFNTWNYLYAEAGGGTFKVMYQGTMKNNELITIDTETESPGVLTPLADLLYIGRKTTGADSKTNYFKGSIDNVRIYNRPLSKAEVLSLIDEDTTK